MKQFVTGIFGSHQGMNAILTDLGAKNFQKNDIIVEDNQKDELQRAPKYNYIPQSFERALIVSVVMGGLLGLLLGMGIIPDPGEVFTTAGPVISTVAGIAVGTTFGSLIGFFEGLYLNQKDKHYYESLIKDKGVRVSVRVKNKREELIARNVLVWDGAVKVIGLPTDASFNRE